MPAKKLTAKTTKTNKPASNRKTSKRTIVSPEVESFESSFSLTNRKLSTRKILAISLIALAIFGLAYYKKGWFVPAIVNGSPVTGIELLERMNKDYRQQTLEQIINEKIVLDEAKKKNALPTSQEIDAKVAELEGKFGGGDSFAKLLKEQGQSKDGVRDQIKLQLAMEKLYSEEATVSAEEIDKFVKENKSQLQATDPTAQREEAEKLLKQQKLSQIFYQKFQELKQNTKVQTF
ncbi:MAG: SurA N-terminal domain-containing protein [Candidatus Blackburnbacteria bacterium]|nr:SurA N-terminal domain-containing protein [Candidatus Blackburnbacteria bacterium]